MFHTTKTVKTFALSAALLVLPAAALSAQGAYGVSSNVQTLGVPAGFSNYSNALPLDTFEYRESDPAGGYWGNQPNNTVFADAAARGWAAQGELRVKTDATADRLSATNFTNNYPYGFAEVRFWDTVTVTSDSLAAGTPVILVFRNEFDVIDLQGTGIFGATFYGTNTIAGRTVSQQINVTNDHMDYAAGLGTITVNTKVGARFTAERPPQHQHPCPLQGLRRHRPRLQRPHPGRGVAQAGARKRQRRRLPGGRLRRDLPGRRQLKIGESISPRRLEPALFTYSLSESAGPAGAFFMFHGRRYTLSPLPRSPQERHGDHRGHFRAAARGAAPDSPPSRPPPARSASGVSSSGPRATPTPCAKPATTTSASRPPRSTSPELYPVYTEARHALRTPRRLDEAERRVADPRFRHHPLAADVRAQRCGAGHLALELSLQPDHPPADLGHRRRQRGDARAVGNDPARLGADEADDRRAFPERRGRPFRRRRDGLPGAAGACRRSLHSSYIR